MTKPKSRIIQIIKSYQDGDAIETEVLTVLCEDGSVWRFYPALRDPWELLVEIVGGEYAKT